MVVGAGIPPALVGERRLLGWGSKEESWARRSRITLVAASRSSSAALYAARSSSEAVVRCQPFLWRDLTCVVASAWACSQ